MTNYDVREKNLENYSKEFNNLIEKNKHLITQKEFIEFEAGDSNIVFATRKIQFSLTITKFLPNSKHDEYKNYLGQYTIILNFPLTLFVGSLEIEERIKKAIHLLNVLIESNAEFGIEYDNMLYL